MYETGIGKHAVLEVFDHLVGCPKHPGRTAERLAGISTVPPTTDLPQLLMNRLQVAALGVFR